MIAQDTPNDGDFASLLEGKAKNAHGPATERPDATQAVDAVGTRPRQTIENVLIEGEEPTEEFLAALNELESLPELSEEELAQQALNDPGEDGDINTPE